MLTKNALVVLGSAKIVVRNDFLKMTDYNVAVPRERERTSESWTSTSQHDSREVRLGTRSWESAIPMVRLHHFQIQYNYSNRPWACHPQNCRRICTSNLPPLPSRTLIHPSNPYPRSRQP